MLRFHAERGARGHDLPDARRRSHAPTGSWSWTTAGRVRALRREAGPGADHHRHDQRRRVRPRPRAPRAHPDRPAGVDRARVLPRAARATASRSTAGSRDNYWLDIGSPAKYRQGQLDLLAGRVATPRGARRRRRRGRARAGAADGRRAPASGRARACSARGCRLAAGARVGPAAVLGDGCVVGRGRGRRGRGALGRRARSAPGARARRLRGRRGRPDRRPRPDRPRARSSPSGAVVPDGAARDRAEPSAGRGGRPAPTVIL